MKHAILLFLIIMMISLFACNDDNPLPPPPPIADWLAKLEAHTWKAGNITKDGNHLAEEYPYFADFTLTFSGSLNADKTNVNNGSTYETSDQGEVLPSSGWGFKEGAEETTLVMNSIDVDYTVTDNTLHLDFTHNPPNGRTEAISGHYIFDLIP